MDTNEGSPHRYRDTSRNLILIGYVVCALVCSGLILGSYFVFSCGVFGLILTFLIFVGFILLYKGLRKLFQSPQADITKNPLYDTMYSKAEVRFRKMIVVHSLIYVVLVALTLFFATYESIEAAYHAGPFITICSTIIFVLIFVTFYGYSSLPKAITSSTKLKLYLLLSIITGAIPLLYTMFPVITYTKIALYGGFLMPRCWGSGSIDYVVDYTILIPIFCGWLALLHFIFFNVKISIYIMKMTSSNNKQSY